MNFRPCIDLHDGVVKQIVGATLNDEDQKALQTNFVASRPSSWYAELYRKDSLVGGHIIKLGGGNDAAASEALAAWPQGMQLGGGVNAENAAGWLAKGASHVIVTSYVFHNGILDLDRLRALVAEVGAERLVLDLSCRKKEGQYYIVTDRWQKFTELVITARMLEELSGYCAEFLIHAADVEGLCRGIETELVELLGGWQGIPITYAGGIGSYEDLQLIRDKGQGRLDFTVGSALDIFGGSQMSYRQTIDFCKIG